MSDKHTPEPWEFFDGTITGHSKQKVIKRRDDFDWVATVQVSNTPEWKANGERIVACVNALQGQDPARVKAKLALWPKMIEALDALAKFNAELCQDVGVSTHYPSADKANALLTEARALEGR